MKKKGVVTAETAQSASLETKLALTALQHYLFQKNAGNTEIAISALAVYMSSRIKQCNSRVIAQMALAMYLDKVPEAMNRESNSFRIIQPMHSTWSNKILLMRQSPIRN